MRTIIVAAFAAALISPSIAAQKPEATSLAGKPLYPLELPNREKLEAVASALLEHETLDEADAYAAAGIAQRVGDTAATAPPS